MRLGRLDHILNTGAIITMISIKQRSTLLNSRHVDQIVLFGMITMDIQDWDWIGGSC